jgi:antitoxin YefM
MEPIPYTRLRSELAKVLDKVNEDRAPVLITRRRGKPAVLMSMEEYSALEETAHLLRSPVNAARLREAREQVEKEIARRARRRRRR